MPKYNDSKIYDIEDKGFNTYIVDDHVFISDYSYVFRPIIINGIKTKYIIDRLGNVYNTITRRRLYPIKSNGGYYRVNLTIEKYKLIHPSIHRLVANAFIKNPFNKPDVNHIDGDKSHNYVENLEWVTKSENIIHAFKIGLMNHKGSNNSRAKLNDEIINKIWDDIEQNYDKICSKEITFSQIANKYGIRRGDLSRIYNGLVWHDIFEKRRKDYMIKHDKKYSDDDIIRAKSMINSGYNIKQISNETGINVNYLYSLKMNKYRKDVK